MRPDGTFDNDKERWEYEQEVKRQTQDEYYDDEGIKRYYGDGDEEED